jgi:hypothetical protein
VNYDLLIMQLAIRYFRFLSTLSFLIDLAIKLYIIFVTNYRKQLDYPFTQKAMFFSQASADLCIVLFSMQKAYLFAVGIQR